MDKVKTNHKGKKPKDINKERHEDFKAIRKLMKWVTVSVARYGINYQYPADFQKTVERFAMNLVLLVHDYSTSTELDKQEARQVQLMNELLAKSTGDII